MFSGLRQLRVGMAGLLGLARQQLEQVLDGFA